MQKESPGNPPSVGDSRGLFQIQPVKDYDLALSIHDRAGGPTGSLNKRWTPLDWELDSIIMTSLGISLLPVPSLAEFAAAGLIGLLGYLLFKDKISDSATMPVVFLMIYIGLALAELAISYMGDLKLYYTAIGICVLKALVGGLFCIYVSAISSWAVLFLRRMLLRSCEPQSV